MATSDVLQFHYYVENECARNATKGFAGILGEAFEQYKKLWDEYLKLQKRCEDIDVKILFAVRESERQNEVAGMPETSEGYASQASAKNTKATTSSYERVSNVLSSEFTSDSDDTVLSDNKPVQNEVVSDELLTSPILVRKRSKSRRSSVARNRSILDDSKDSSACLSMKENNTILISNTQEDVSKEMECSFTDNNNDQIECTPISKMPRKLGVSKLYNVDTTLLQSGKMLKQSKLVFLPTEETTTANAAYKVCKENALRPHMSPTPAKNVIGNSKNGIKPMDEEIIETSPTHGVESNLKIKSLRLKRKNPARHIQKHSIFDKIIDNKTGTKLPLTEIHQASVSQRLPVDTSTQNDESQLIKRSKTYAPLHPERIPSTVDITNSPLSQLLVTSQDVYFEDSDFDTELSIPVEETRSVENAENDNQAEKLKLSESTSQSQNCNSSTCDDETFFNIEENLRQNPTRNVDALKEKVSHSKILQFPHVKKSLMDSFDIVPEKKDVPNYRPSKSKSERSKMTGVSCWECKQYYASLGLSEDEIRARQNQCSRHRTVHNERKDTPEGLWDPLFPDTFTTTFQDD